MSAGDLCATNIFMQSVSYVQPSEKCGFIALMVNHDFIASFSIFDEESSLKTATKVILLRLLFSFQD